jgi:hypothetical protein
MLYTPMPGIARAHDLSLSGADGMKCESRPKGGKDPKGGEEL